MKRYLPLIASLILFPALFITRSMTKTETQSIQEADEALDGIEKAISSQPNNGSLYSEKDSILSDLKRYSNAEVASKQAIEINPRSNFYNNRGNLYQNQGKTELALSSYNQAISLNPNYALAYINRGNLYQNQGKTELDLSDYNQAISLNPEQAEVYYNRGLLYSYQGKLELAIANYEQVIVLNPNDAETYGNLGLLHTKIGNSESARSNLQEARQLFLAQGRTADAKKATKLLKQLQ